MSADVHWTTAGSPYQINATLTIAKGSVLTIDPGVTAHFGTGAGLHISGQILADGTADARIILDGTGVGSWNGITIDYTGDTTVHKSEIKFATIQHAGTLINVNATGNSDILVEDCVMDHWSNLAIDWDNGANHFRVTRCEMGLHTPISEQSHEAINGYRSSAVVEYCTFGPRKGYNDTIDLGNTKWGGPVPTVQFNDIGPGEDDGIDFDDCDGFIIGNFIHGHRPPANGPKESGCPQYPIGGGGVNGGGLTGNQGSRPWVMNNIIFDCYHAIGYKNGALPTIINNTVVGCDWGIVLFKEADVSTAGLAHGTLINNLIWDCKIPIKLSWCDPDPKSSVDVTHCIVPGGWTGAGNIDVSASPLAVVPSRTNPSRDDFRLARCSPAIDAAKSGRITQTFHAEDVPATDSEGTARVDMTTVPDTGIGASTFYDVGAVEFTGPDDCTAAPASFVRGEANADGNVDISDAVTVLFVLFAGRATDCEDALDVNDDGALNVTDAIALLDYLFRAGPQPAAPFPAKGADPTSDDALSCSRT